MRKHPPSFSPLYRQIKTLVTQSLQAGEWKPGAAIPSENELAARYRVSQGTVRKAIDELAAENLVTRRQGKGTFVATHNEPRNLFRFLRLMPDAGEQEYPASKLLECRRGRASAEAARLLGLKSGEPVVILRRLLIFSGEPAVIDETWLPGALFPKLTAAIFEQYKGSLYKLFETEFGVRMIRAQEKIRRGRGVTRRCRASGRGAGASAAAGRARDLYLRRQTGWNGGADGISPPGIITATNFSDRGRHSTPHRRSRTVPTPALGV
ncbi:MAG: GntR family transcriptional regulator [Rhodospirillales bacterium]